MFWLFGQIWLWLIVAFALGALTSWVVLRAAARPRSEPVRDVEPEPDDHEPPPPLSTEQTQFIPAAWAQHAPERRGGLHDDEEAEPVGHREGHLPLPPQRGAQDEQWPTEDEPAWPESEEATPQWPQQPGRSG
ncbi:hypothetical protein [Amycolatopsis sp. Hca4]|uniref:hypothetical protein n=1 Tax=unclassified Amycolatopsis TaxID=2618356 RepID=UPI00158F9F7F|nr:hypothetical protein [Amycolatopsis sp. Hca4]QKV77785.1 hypothetical protein HUT10_31400 [Amycolatopsis sp. Hca4]